MLATSVHSFRQCGL